MTLLCDSKDQDTATGKRKIEHSHRAKDISPPLNKKHINQNKLKLSLDAATNRNDKYNQAQA